MAALAIAQTLCSNNQLDVNILNAFIKQQGYGDSFVRYVMSGFNLLADGETASEELKSYFIKGTNGDDTLIGNIHQYSILWLNENNLLECA